MIRHHFGTSLVSAVLLAVVANSGREATAITAEQLDRHDLVDAVFARWDKPDTPGCALGVIQDGELIYQQGYGMANLDWDIPITPETVFYVGSVSKQFAAAAVALLAQDGTLSLDDDIRKYFPEMPTYEKQVTIRHLIHHTGGIRDIYTLMSLAGLRIEDVFPDDDAVTLIAGQQETNFTPGDEYLYSNSDYFLLAELFERAADTTLREYGEERIFGPLGMTDTHFHDQSDHVLKRRAMSYGVNPLAAAEERFVITYLGNFNKVGAGGLYTTIRDLLLWDRNFYSGKVGGQNLLDQIHTRGVLSNGQELDYAFGLILGDYRGLRTVGHDGSMMGFRATYLQFPEQRFSVAIACNLGNISPGVLARQVADLYLADSFTAPRGRRREGGRSQAAGRRQETMEIDTAALEAYTGVYDSEELGVSYELFLDGDALTVTMPNRAPFTLQPVRVDVFRGPWAFMFERDAADAVTAFRVNAGRVTNIRFVRRARD
ncbi:MAG: serine hydrolase domain-containing protein [Vicinamibacterales bacterium]